MMLKSINKLLYLSVAVSIFFAIVGCSGDGGSDIPFIPSTTPSTTPSPTDADLSLTKTVDIPTPDVGTDVVFTITLSNAGPLTATGVVVTDQLPSGFTYVTDDSGEESDLILYVWVEGTDDDGDGIADPGEYRAVSMSTSDNIAYRALIDDTANSGGERVSFFVAGTDLAGNSLLGGGSPGLNSDLATYFTYIASQLVVEDVFVDEVIVYPGLPFTPQTTGVYYVAASSGGSSGGVGDDLTIDPSRGMADSVYKNLSNCVAAGAFDGDTGTFWASHLFGGEAAGRSLSEALPQIWSLWEYPP